MEYKMSKLREKVKLEEEQIISFAEQALGGKKMSDGEIFQATRMIQDDVWSDNLEATNLVEVYFWLKKWNKRVA